MSPYKCELSHLILKMHNTKSTSTNSFMGRLAHGATLLETGARYAGMAKGIYDAGKVIVPLIASVL